MKIAIFLRGTASTTGRFSADWQLSGALLLLLTLAGPDSHRNVANLAP
jgi:hypothetical protein